VTGSGPKGRLLKEDVQRFLSADRSMPSLPASSPSSAPPSLPSPSPPLSQDKVVPIGGLSRIMVQTMTQANLVPTFVYCDEILMDQLFNIRESLKSVTEKQGIKLSYFPFMIKAASMSLYRYPSLNAHVNSNCTELIFRSNHNIGIAMDTPRGLLVPNIKNVQDKSIIEIAKELSRLSTLGKESRLSSDDLKGGTFTLSNIGAIGGTYSSPLLVVPEVVIGAVGRIQTLPRYNQQQQLYPARVLNASWSADHRVVDGATMARFSNHWKSLLENPSAMLLDTK